LLINGVLGLNGEAGEVADLIKKWKFQGHLIPKDDLIEELGDILWYVAITAESIDVSLGEVAFRNIEKLKKRFPNGFSVDRSVNRER
jgi:NTP pyrophosphatase (non-canonical NTP hydrolase)